MATVWGVRIYLDKVLSQDTSIGLYTSGTSELRWVEAPITASDSSPTTWASGMLTAPLDPISQAADFSRGGGVANLTGTTVKVANTSQFSKTLSDASVDLHGLKLEIWEFVTNLAGTASSRSLIFTGVVADVSWNETEMVIDADDAGSKRKANILTTINNDANGNFPNAASTENGVVVPATFGEIGKARMVRTSKKETVLTNTDIDTACQPIGLKRFPVTSVQTEATLYYEIQIDLSRGGSSTFTSVTGKNLRVVAGSKSNGAIRRIASCAESTVGGVDTLQITLNDYFEETLIGSSDATATGNAWVEIVDIEREYISDLWDGKAFMSSDAVPVEIEVPDLFSYVSPRTVDVSGEAQTLVAVKEKQRGYYPLPQYAYIEKAGATHNNIDLDAKLFNQSPDDMVAWRIVTPTWSSIDLCNRDEIQVGDALGSTFWKLSAGLYQGGGASVHHHYRNLSVPTFSDFMLVVDKNARTGVTLSAEYYSELLDDNALYGYAIEMDPPAPPADFEYDTAYLMVGLNVDHDPDPHIPGDIRFANQHIIAYTRGFIGSETAILNKPLSIDGTRPYLSSTVCDLPDFYTGDSSNNVNFYVNVLYPEVTGYMNFPIPRSTYEGGIFKIGLIHWWQSILTHDDWFHVSLNLKEIAIAFSKTVSIENEIYSGLRGRIYKDTWSGRKSTASLMDRPQDILEHVLRLQNWSELGVTLDSGHQYAAGALIATYGSFDTSVTDSDWKFARQVLDLSDGDTDALARSLCRSMWAVNYRNASGYECVKSILATGYSTTVTLGSVFGDITVTEPSPADVFVHPYVRYLQNYGSDKFDAEMRVTNANAAAWSPAYTLGITGTGTITPATADGEVIWNACNALWSKFRQIETPPSELTDLVWVRDYTTAVKYLYNWVSWMGKRRIQFSVAYTVGQSWFVGTHVGVNFPHHTDDTTVEVVVEKIVKDKNSTPAKCQITAVMLT